MRHSQELYHLWAEAEAQMRVAERVWRRKTGDIEHAELQRLRNVAHHRLQVWLAEVAEISAMLAAELRRDRKGPNLDA